MEESYIEFSIAESSQRVRELRRRKIFSLLMLFYSVFIPTFIYFGMTEISSSETYAAEAASATEKLEIPAIALEALVKVIKKQGVELIAPDQIAGVYHAAKNKDFVIGHSSTIFRELGKIREGDEVSYNGEKYMVRKVETLEKAEISMAEILVREEKPTIVLMTCAGKSLGGQDYTERLIVWAEKKTEEKSALMEEGTAEVISALVSAEEGTVKKMGGAEKNVR